LKESVARKKILEENSREFANLLFEDLRSNWCQCVFLFSRATHRRRNCRNSVQLSRINVPYITLT